MDAPNNESALANDTKAIEFIAHIQANQRQPQNLQPLRPDFRHQLEELRKPKPQLTPEQELEAINRQARLALARQQSERDGRLAALVAQAGRRYADCTFANFTGGQRQRDAAAAVDDWVASMLDAWESSGLVLYGPVGTGKDHLAFAACRDLILQQGKSVLWINGQAWFGEVRDSMDSDKTTEAEIIRRLKTPDILVISDPLPPFGELSQHQAVMLYRAVDARYSEGKPTICTINVSDDDEADRRMGAATWDRLCHNAHKVHCKWASFRKPK